MKLGAFHGILGDRGTAGWKTPSRKVDRVEHVEELRKHAQAPAASQAVRVYGRTLANWKAGRRTAARTHPSQARGAARRSPSGPALRKPALEGWLTCRVHLVQRRYSSFSWDYKDRQLRWESNGRPVAGSAGGRRALFSETDRRLDTQRHAGPVRPREHGQLRGDVVNAGIETREVNEPLGVGDGGACDPRTPEPTYPVLPTA